MAITSTLAAEYLIRRFLGESSALLGGRAQARSCRSHLNLFWGTGGSGSFQGRGEQPCDVGRRAIVAANRIQRLLAKCLLRDAYYPSRNLFILNTDFLAISRAGRV